MKNLKLSLLFTSLILFAAACRKEDFKSDLPSPAVQPATASQTWQSLATWSKAETAASFFSKIPDSAITAEVAREGLILVYKKDGSTVKSLPVQEGNVAWHYQVSRGSLRINSENGDGKALSLPLFSYFIITPGKLSELEAGGKTKLALLDLTYEEAAAILHP